jgi:hypothetical protein
VAHQCMGWPCMGWPSMGLGFNPWWRTSVLAGRVWAGRLCIVCGALCLCFSGSMVLQCPWQQFVWCEGLRLHHSVDVCWTAAVAVVAVPVCAVAAGVYGFQRSCLFVYMVLCACVCAAPVQPHLCAGTQCPIRGSGTA